MSYDITENKRDLDLLDNAEPNLSFRGGDYFMECSYQLMDSVGKRSINPEDFEFEIIELYQGANFIKVSKNDVEALARHFGLVEGEK